MKQIALALLLSVSLGGCMQVPDEDALRLLQNEGVENPVLGGRAWFGCSEKDNMNVEFSGKRNGQYVEGIICGSATLFFHKAYTVRYW